MSTNDNQQEATVQTIHGQIKATMGGMSAPVSNRLLPLVVAERSVWSMTTAEQLIAVGEWVVYMLYIQAYVYAGPLQAQDAATLPAATVLFDESERLVDLALDLHAKTDDARIKGVPGRIGLQPPPGIVISDELDPLTWKFYESMFQELEIMTTRMSEHNVPARLQRLFDRICEQILLRKEQMKSHHTQWKAAIGAEKKKARLEAAAILMDELFQLGQVLWAPSLLNDELKRKLKWADDQDDEVLSFNPWALTGYNSFQVQKGDPSNLQELRAFWGSVVNADDVPRIIAFLRENIEQRCIRDLSNDIITVPWQPRYQVRFPISYGGKHFAIGEVLVVFPVPTDDDRFRLAVRKSPSLTPPQRLGIA